MKYYIGVDGGGTKTAYALCDETGNILKVHHTGGSCYYQYGVEAVEGTLREGVSTLLDGVEQPVSGAVLGLSCVGENLPGDMSLKSAVARAMRGIPHQVVNDVEVGLAGSLALEEGINIVSGTGSIAMGRDASGALARSGGWGEYFGDEGSCHWLGQKTLELFSKEADGRLPRGSLYTLIRENFSIQSDFDMIDVAIRDLLHRREKVAALQRILEKAARLGDGAAVRAYALASEELTATVLAVKNRLSFPGVTKVSYSGGLFKAGALILDPLRAMLEQENCVLRAPQLPPLGGALLLAAKADGITGIAGNVNASCVKWAL